VRSALRAEWFVRLHTDAVFVGVALLVVGMGLTLRFETARGFLHFFDVAWIRDGRHTRTIGGRDAVITMVVARVAAVAGAAAIVVLRVA